MSKALDRHLSEFAETKGNEVFNKISRRKIAAVVPVHIFGLPQNTRRGLLKMEFNSWSRMQQKLWEVKLK